MPELNDCQLHAELRLAQGRLEQAKDENLRLRAAVGLLRGLMRKAIAEAKEQAYSLPEMQQALATRTGEEEEQVLRAAVRFSALWREVKAGPMYLPGFQGEQALEALHVAVQEMEKRRA
jgi:hypothetical protein